MFNNQNKRSAFFTTIIFHLLLFLVFLFSKMPYLEQSREMMVVLDFGGVSSKYVNTQVEKTFHQDKNQEQKDLVVKENTLTEDKEDIPVIIQKKPKKPKKVKPKPSKNTLSAISNLINSKKNHKNHKTIGQSLSDKIGSIGSGGGNKKTLSGKGSYQLEGREPIRMPKPKYDCKEQGKVVVRIIVDKYGKVLIAEAGVKGTTNSAPCLLENAKFAALKTTWSPSHNSPQKQEGKIIYNFYIRH